MQSKIVDSISKCYIGAAAVGLTASALFEPLPQYLVTMLLTAPLPLGILGGALRHLAQEIN